MMYKAFISFKNQDINGRQTRDSKIAEQLYQQLKKRGVEVFFSNEEVQRKCRPDYGKLIDEALESSRVLILVGTSAEYVSSKWVEYEWRTFNNEIQSGRKDGHILTVLEGMSVGQLPIAVRQWESYSSAQLDRAADMVCGILGGEAKAASGGTEAAQDTLHYSNAEYVGEVRNGKANGYGIIKFDDGRRYEGELSDDKRNGKGTQYFPDGNRYEGEWRDDKYNGRGTFYWSDGDRYEGEFKDGKRNNRGTQYFASGNRYEGEWKDDKRNGHGTFYWSDGRRLEGEWKDGHGNGDMIFYYADGRSESQRWKDGKQLS